MASEGLENLVNAIIEEMEESNNTQASQPIAQEITQAKSSTIQVNNDKNTEQPLNYQASLNNNNDINTDPVLEDHELHQYQNNVAKQQTTNHQRPTQSQASDEDEAEQFLAFTKNISQDIYSQQLAKSNNHTEDIIQTLISNDKGNQSKQFHHIADELSQVSKTAYDHLLQQDEDFLSNLKDRLLVLFEGFHSPYQKNQEAKIDILINFLEYLLSVVDERLDEVKQARSS